MSLRTRLRTLLEWLLLGSAVGFVCGIASVFFLWLLDRATHVRTQNESIVYALPLAGFCIGWLYQRVGSQIRGGSNLVIETLHRDGPQIPWRMAPIVLIGTVLTHLFGGSAGREGTAVQMGASLSDGISHRLNLRHDLRRQILAAGVAAGFGSVFGTPFAGAVFGVELFMLGRFEGKALFPALVASIVGDQTTRYLGNFLGVEHTHYPTVGHLDFTPVLVAKWLLVACAIAAVSVVFIELNHGLKKQCEKHLPSLPVRMLVGGLLVIVLWNLVGTSDYLGLGVPTILRSFEDPSLPSYAFALKLIFTAVTLSAGFLGGEVTPLFFVGASLGNVLARGMGIPIEMGAGVGMAAIFAASANAPIALTIMAVELLGLEVLPHVLLVNAVAYLLIGRRSIYEKQRVERKRWIR